MTRYDPTTAEILVFTFKEGLLSAVAHDLKIRVTNFTIDVEGTSVKAEIDASSLRTVCAVKEGADYPSGIPSIALSEVDRNMLGSVLEARKHQAIRFVSTTVTDSELVGELTLHGVTRTVRGTRRDTPRHAVGEFRLDQRDFGLKIFTAMLGTLKIKPEVLVRVSLPK